MNLKLLIFMASIMMGALCVQVRILPTYGDDSSISTSTNTIMKVSDDLIAFWFKDADTLCYFDKAKYLQSLSSKLTCKAGSGLKGVYSTQNFIIEQVTNNGNQFTANLCNLNNGAVQCSQQTKSFTNSGDFKYINYLESFYSYDFVTTTDASYHTLVLSTYSSQNTLTRDMSTTEPFKYTLTPISSTQLQLFYFNSQYLFSEIVDQTFTTKQTAKVQVSCVNSISASDQMVAISCYSEPLLTVSVFRNSDLGNILTQSMVLGSSGSSVTIKMMSLSSKYQMLFYNPDLSSCCENNLKFIEIIPDKLNPDAYYIEDKPIFSGFSNFTNSKGTYFNRFGESYEIDSDGRLFVGSITATSSSTPNAIVETEICSHSQYYSVSNRTCYATQDNYLTFEIQDTSQVACINANISSDYNEAVVNSVCSYTCNSTLVGVNCESCNDYMNRRGISAGMYNTFTYDSTTKQCSKVTDPLYCSKHTYCLDCFRTIGCTFLSNVCDKGTAYTTFSYDDYSRNCPLNFIHNTTNCGFSGFDIDKNDIKNLKSIKNSPKDTLCYYNVTSKSKITKSIQFNLTSSELVLITQSTNGMRYTVKPSVGTAIQTFGRFLADSSAQVYSIYNADYFTVTYTTTSDVSTGLSSQEVGSTDETIWKYPVPAIIPIILSLVIILFIIVFFFLCCIWICRCIKNKKQNEGNSKNDSQPLVNKEDDMIELEDSEAQE